MLKTINKIINYNVKMHIWLHFNDFIGQNDILLNNIKYGLHKRIKLYNKLYFFGHFSYYIILQVILNIMDVRFNLEL